MYAEDKRDGEPLPIASHEVLAELIERAGELIAHPTNWFKLAPKFHGQPCMETALSEVLFEPDDARGWALARVSTAVQRMYPQYHPHYTCRPALFSDLGSTTHDDVMLVMSVAAEIARQELGGRPISTPEVLHGRRRIRISLGFEGYYWNHRNRQPG